MSKRSGPSIFAQQVIRWQRRSGRSHLPWQGTRDAYRIWLSEVMLQQTQVTTVIPYYERFLARFPDVRSLANASVDDVLTLWSGLGYYSRGRNLHAAARLVVDRFGGAFPTERQLLESLPGVGRSTAAAIAAFSAGKREAILDGNVKRVLCRAFAVEGIPTQPATLSKLWDLAESLLPGRGIEAYTQGLMDLGATVCTRAAPACDKCPVAMQCEARRQDRQAELPQRAARKATPHRRTVMLILVAGGQVLLEQRAESGLWGGLWSLPEFTSVRQAEEASRLQVHSPAHETLPPLAHAFTHFSLTIVPVLAYSPARASRATGTSKWWDLKDALEGPIPTPVRKLLRSIADRLSSADFPARATGRAKRAARAGRPSRATAA